MVVVFDITKVPRHTTRQEWREAYRWVRVQRKVLKKQEDTKIELLRTHGDTMLPRMKQDLMNHLIYPPILLGPWQ